MIKAATSASDGRAGIAPFLVVVMAPQAFANVSISLNFFSSYNNQQQFQLIPIKISFDNHFNKPNKLSTWSTDWSSTILQRRAPTNESPAPVVSTALTLNGSTDPRKFCNEECVGQKWQKCQRMECFGNKQWGQVCEVMTTGKRFDVMTLRIKTHIGNSAKKTVSTH